MIFEYALEPILLNNWPDFRYFTEQFGVPQGRLISEYPKRWKKLVYQSLNCGEIERARITEGLLRINEKPTRRVNLGWDESLNWLGNATAEHGRKPFRAILALANPDGLAFVLKGEDVNEAITLWHVDKTRIVPRIAAQMAQAVGPLLLTSEVIRLTDPHFNPNREQYRVTLQGFLSASLAGRVYPAPRIVEVHLSADGDLKPTAEYFAARCQELLPGRIPSGVEVRFIRWHQKTGGEELHNRYVLTDLGGIRFGAGLDERDAGETDELEILDKDAYRVRYSQYDPAGATFDLADQVVVIGTRH
jgi:hypothetical protein